MLVAICKFAEVKCGNWTARGSQLFVSSCCSVQYNFYCFATDPSFEVAMGIVQVTTNKVTNSVIGEQVLKAVILSL